MNEVPTQEARMAMNLDIPRLRERIETLEERNRQLEEAFMLSGKERGLMCQVFRLRPKLGDFLALLMAQPHVSHEQAFTAMHGMAVDVPNWNVYGVMICQLRKVLGREAIRTDRARGWFIPDEQKRRIRARVAAFVSSQQTGTANQNLQAPWTATNPSAFSE